MFEKQTHTKKKCTFFEKKVSKNLHNSKKSINFALRKVHQKKHYIQIKVFENQTIITN